ncbi:prolyl aminopeptidase [Thiocapsa rosea]|uniref:Proline iminopeptidase n=1 Tax=Thiocapsa rosea TaxID=69360 RepID=A0A495VF63_9GAMM|nr:prolyl aminopeptidase [Thiocapsa rosea]RKT47095.1 prolyl aminopeptidase [Thiocapsa rosea]
MNPLYLPIEPYAIHHLDVGAGHRLHVEECGCPEGIPVIFLHGGPGSGCRADHRRYFDPGHYRILLFDQRGSGRSTPAGSSDHNETAHLIEDMERIRTGLKVDRWLLFGGSWGAALALLYAQTYPTEVLGLVLRGTFLARQRDLDWFFGPDGVARLLPDAWQAFLARIPAGEQQDPIGAYARRLHGPDNAVAIEYALAWAAWGDRVVTWNRSAVSAGTDTARILAQARIESRYARHLYFLADNAVLEAAARLPAVPLVIVHGARDLVCPLEGAWALHRAVPGSRLRVVEEAGHPASDPAIIDALVSETDRFHTRPASA